MLERKSKQNILSIIYYLVDCWPGKQGSKDPICFTFPYSGEHENEKQIGSLDPCFPGQQSTK